MKAPVVLAIGMLYAGGPEREAHILGLGSCLAVAVFEPHAKLFALAHCLLPEQGEGRPPSTLPAKFVDAGIAMMLAALEMKGARRGAMMAKLAGGAAMFPVLGREVRPHVGERNIETAHRVLRGHGVVIAGEEIGGGEGRTVIADPVRCALRVQTLRGGERLL